MKVIKNYILSLIEKGSRIDQRKFDEYRKPIKIEYGISPKAAQGSAKVTIGETEVVAGIKMDVGEPYPDKPDEGTIIVNVELLPLSSDEFESGPPSIEAIELARAVVDRGIRESKAIDFKKLCIKKGEKSWLVLIDVYSLNDAGNLADAIGLAALAALQDAKFPFYDEKKEKIDYEKKAKPLKLTQLSVPVTVLKIKDKFIIDPTTAEEEIADAKLTVTTTEDGRICALQKGGTEPLTGEEIEKMVELGAKKGKELRALLKK